MTADPVLLHKVAQYYLACVYPFPPELEPEHLDVPEPERIFQGLKILHRAVQDLYQAYTRVQPANEKTVADVNYCWKVLGGSMFLLWSLGMFGDRIDGPQGVELSVEKSTLSTSTPGRKIQEFESILPGLQEAGFQLTFWSADGSTCPSGWKRCQFIRLGWPKDPTEADALWTALRLFARRVDIRQPGVPFEAFLRVDFRSLLPGGNPAEPPYTLQEAWDTLDAKTASMWREMADYLAHQYPRYVSFFRHPDMKRRTWGINYDTQAKGYGLFSLYGDQDGFRVRMVFKKDGRAYVLGHINELSPRMQEMFLTRITCTDCKHCGQHEFYPHGDHIHKLCAGAWFYSSLLEPEDLPSVKRLIEIHITHLR